jgi:hypothetical protein
VLQSPGWWHRSTRRIFGESAQALLDGHEPEQHAPPRPILICGGEDAPTHAALVVACQQRGLAQRGFAGEHSTLRSADDIAQMLDCMDPWAVIHIAQATGSSREATLMHQENVLERLAIAASRRGIPILTFSWPSALKSAAEVLLLNHNPHALCVSFPSPTAHFVNVSLDLLIDGERGHWCLSDAAPGLREQGIYAAEGRLR